MAFCSNCGQRTDENAKFCSNCGVPIREVNNIKLKNIKCPNCQADIHYQEDADKMTCHYCGADFVIDDEATELNRILNAKINAKQRDTQINMEYENHQHSIQSKNEIKNFIFRNPIFCLAAVFVLIYALIRIFKGDFAGIDIIFDTLILCFVYRITNKKTKK